MFFHLEIYHKPPSFPSHFQPSLFQVVVAMQLPHHHGKLTVFLWQQIYKISTQLATLNLRAGEFGCLCCAQIWREANQIRGRKCTHGLSEIEWNFAVTTATVFGGKSRERLRKPSLVQTSSTHGQI